MLSILLPLIRVNILDYFNGQGSVAKVIYTMTVQDEIVIELGKSSAYSTNFLLAAGYALVSIFFIATLLMTFIKIGRLRRNNQQTEVKGIQFINTNASGTPFSFFNSIFWNRKIDLSSIAGQQILDHEIAHIREKHTYDKLFINVVLLFYWINPFFWLIRKELNMIHEFVADKFAMEDADVTAFAEMILASIYPQKQFSITNNFFYSPIKRRLLMLTKNKNSKVNYISRLLVLPIAVIMFVFISCKAKTSTENSTTTNQVAINDTPAQPQNLPVDSSSDMYYQNKKVSDLRYTNPDGKGVLVKVLYDDGSTETITESEAKKRGFPEAPPPPPAAPRSNKPSTPPPPPPPPVRSYKGKVIKSVEGAFNDGTVILHYADGTQEKITTAQAKKAGFTYFTPPKATIRYTPPKVVKDGEVMTDIKEVTGSKSGNNKQNSEDMVFTKVDKEASFPGGLAGWTKYVTRAINSDIDAISENKEFGTATIRFIVDKNGNVSDVEAITMKGSQLAKTAVEAIRKGPKWTPAQQNGRFVTAYRLQPVTLKNPDN
jgi:outer membrane biosynthesis protein TonB